MSARDDRVEELYEYSTRELAEWVTDLEPDVRWAVERANYWRWVARREAQMRAAVWRWIENANDGYDDLMAIMGNPPEAKP